MSLGWIKNNHTTGGLVNLDRVRKINKMQMMGTDWQVAAFLDGSETVILFSGTQTDANTFYDSLWTAMQEWYEGSGQMATGKPKVAGLPEFLKVAF